LRLIMYCLLNAISAPIFCLTIVSITPSIVPTYTRRGYGSPDGGVRAEWLHCQRLPEGNCTR
jgi:hypothetical protein